MKRQTAMIPLILLLIASCARTPAHVETNNPTRTRQPTQPMPAPTSSTTGVEPTSNAMGTRESTQPTPAPTSSATGVGPTATLPSPPQPTTAPADTNSLRSHAQACGVQIGAAVAADPLRSEPRYAETLAREFNLLTPENSLKFETVHPGQDRYAFGDADYIAQFAETRGMQARGHTLVWHDQLPAWLTEGNWTRDELIEILRDHILTVVGRYRGRVAAWDVVNEAVDSSGSPRDTIWLRVIGPEYIEMAFRWAHEADPEARLFYNDYGAEGLGPKSDAVYALVRDLMQRGVPIHGVGLQMHLSLGDRYDLQDLAANIDRLAALGLDVHITEMDVRIQEPVTAEKLEDQATIYGSTLQVCLSSPGCKAFVLWGFADRHSWIPEFFPGYGAGLIFDENYDRKPACDALQDVLTNP